jgi:hypothetical protein
LRELPSLEHPNGTYAEALLDSDTKKKLLEFIAENDILNSVKEFHCTVVYSKAACPSVKEMKVRFPVIAKITEFALFDAKPGSGDGKCLVACLDAVELNRYHYDAREQYGATTSYPMYIPHITLSYDFEGDIPEVPEFDIVFNKIKVSPLGKRYRR